MVPALILLCLLLAGCSGKGEETTFPTQTEAVPVEAAPPPGLHDPNDPWKCATATHCGRIP